MSDSWNHKDMFNGRPKQNKRNILCITCVHLYLHALQFHLKNATANWAPLLCLISCSQPSPLTTSRGGEVNMAACNSEREIALIFTAQNLWGKKRERGSVHFHSFYFRFFRSISELHPLDWVSSPPPPLWVMAGSLTTLDNPMKCRTTGRSGTILHSGCRCGCECFWCVAGESVGNAMFSSGSLFQWKVWWKWEVKKNKRKRLLC